MIREICLHIVMTMDRYPYVACACKSRADSKITRAKSWGPQGLCQGGVVKGGFWGRLGGSQPGSPHSAVLTLSFTCSQDPLLRVQEVLNGTEVNLQHLTALVDCRSLHLVRATAGRGCRGGQESEQPCGVEGNCGAGKRSGELGAKGRGELWRGQEWPLRTADSVGDGGLSPAWHQGIQAAIAEACLARPSHTFCP